jgi:hypothetical protein
MADTSTFSDLEYAEIDSWKVPDPPPFANRPATAVGTISNIGLDPNRPNKSSIRVLPRQLCEWCMHPLGPQNHSGRTRLYCSQSCRQRAYQSRKRSKQLSLREGEIVVSSVLVNRMNKRLRALDQALVEVEKANLQSCDERVWQLCQAAKRLGRQVIGPPAR